jgi:hypothetical protein
MTRTIDEANCLLIMTDGKKVAIANTINISVKL